MLGNAFSRSVTSQLRAEMYEARVWRSRGKEAEAGGEEGRDGERAEAGGRRREEGKPKELVLKSRGRGLQKKIRAPQR